MIRRFLIIVMLLASSDVQAQVGPGQFHLLAQKDYPTVSDIAVAGRSLFLLQQRSLRIADLDAPGNELQADNAVQLNSDYDRIQYLKGELWLWSFAGRMARIDVSSKGLTEPEYLAAGDSVLALARVGDLIIAAHGYSGMGIYRLAAQNELERRQLIRRGVHYTEVIASGDLVAAVDSYNGLEVYGADSDSLVFQARIFSDSPLKLLAATHDRLAATYGVSMLRLWTITRNGELTSAQDIDVGFPISAITSDGEAFLIGGSSGELAEIQQGSTEVSLLQKVGIRALRLAVAADSNDTSVAVLDPLSGISIYALGGAGNSSARTLKNNSVPHAIALGSQQALGVDSRGIIGYQAIGDKLIPQSLWENGSALVDIVVEDSLLFAVSRADQKIYALGPWAGKYRLRAAGDLPFAPNRLFVAGASLSSLDIAVCFAEAVEMLRYDLATQSFTQVWYTPVPFLIAAADFGSSSFAVVSEKGQLFYSAYDPFTGPKGLPIEATINPLPRDLLITSNFIAEASPAGLSIYRADSESGEFQLTLSPIAIQDATALAYDAASSILAVGTSRGIEYTDYSDPDAIGAFYSIPETDSIRKLSLSDGLLQNSSNSAVQLYEFTPGGIPGARSSEPAIVAAEFYPNPFNSATAIELSIPRQSIGKPISYEIVNVLGQRIWRNTSIVVSAEQRFIWEGRSNSGTDVASGVYIFRAAVADDVIVRKLVYLK